MDPQAPKPYSRLETSHKWLTVLHVTGWLAGSSAQPSKSGCQISMWLEAPLPVFPDFWSPASRFIIPLPRLGLRLCEILNPLSRLWSSISKCHSFFQSWDWDLTNKLWGSLQLRLESSCMRSLRFNLNKIVIIKMYWLIGTLQSNLIRKFSHLLRMSSGSSWESQSQWSPIFLVWVWVSKKGIV